MIIILCLFQLSVFIIILINLQILFVMLHYELFVCDDIFGFQSSKAKSSPVAPPASKDDDDDDDDESAGDMEEYMERVVAEDDEVVICAFELNILQIEA